MFGCLVVVVFLLSVLAGGGCLGFGVSVCGSGVCVYLVVFVGWYLAVNFGLCCCFCVVMLWFAFLVYSVGYW